ncbi:protein rep, partial [Pseudomonas aeruginosa]|nr:protein rep [Pseudomonas aeruginosa]
MHRSTEHGKAFFSGLQVCASVWACPVCAAKISERRRAELVTAVALAKSMGMHVKLLTLTVPHGLGDDLPTLLGQIRNAWRRTTTGRAGKDFRKLLGIKGTIRALEVTHGQNGFHPHLHVLLFLEQDATNACVQGLFTPIWQDACAKAGLPRPSEAHGCRVDDGSKAAAYASKWGLESEMTKSHTKQGRNGSRTPWDFLRAFLERSEGW